MTDHPRPPQGLFGKARRWFVGRVYADHNQTPKVRERVGALCAGLGPLSVALNIGSGGSRLHERVFNVDVVASPGVDIIADAAVLPIRSGSCDAVFSQEVVEHVAEPFAAVTEMYRVLKPGGLVYCQVPFVIGYHPTPTDYWRFTREGLGHLLERAGFDVLEVSRSVGGGTGAYRILVEMVACLTASAAPRLYHPAKAAAAFAAFPLKWLDPILERSSQADRIAGGFFAVGVKRDIQGDAKPNPIVLSTPVEFPRS